MFVPDDSSPPPNLNILNYFLLVIYLAFANDFSQQRHFSCSFRVNASYLHYVISSFLDACLPEKYYLADTFLALAFSSSV